MPEIITKKPNKAIIIKNPERDFAIYQKNKGLGEYAGKRQAYFSLAVEYGITPQAIAKVCKRVARIIKQTEGKYFTHNGIPLRGGDLR